MRGIVPTALLLSTLPAAGVELHGIVTDVQDGDSVTLSAFSSRRRSTSWPGPRSR